MVAFNCVVVKLKKMMESHSPIKNWREVEKLIKKQTLEIRKAKGSGEVNQLTTRLEM